ncbi:MAG: ketoacyl-ACP synthase III [Chitinophagales bacterium]|nr:ketoacyl-ACP synthase III [Chitinophagales bacterium]
MKGWGVKIIGTGGHLPGKPVTNQEVIDAWDLDLDPEYIEKVVGITTRHWADEGTGTSHMAAEACKIAMERANIKPEQLDRIILGTGTADYTSLAAAGRIQHILGATCPAEDTVNACASFVYALDRAVRLLATGAEYVLVAGADIKSRFLTKKDERFIPVFGDGAGAVVLSKCSTEEGFMEIALWQDGYGIDKLNVPAGGSLIPPTHKTLDDGLHGTIMTIDSKEFLQRAVAVMKNLGEKVCSSYGIKPGDVDYFVMHQANMYVMKKVAEALEIPLEKMEVTIDIMGNSMAGTIPFTLNSVYEKRDLKPGQTILMLTAGAGFSGGSALYVVPE